MAFWSKKSVPTHPAGRDVQPDEATRENPYRALNPDAFDRGAKINREAAELRRVAAKTLSGADVLTALLTALGNEIADTVSRRNPRFSPDQKLHVIDETLDAVCPAVREAAYIAADLPAPPPQNDEGADLTEQQFKDLTIRIVNAATKNNTPVGDALSATAKALGVQISVLAQRDTSAEELIKFSQNAVAEFAREALTSIRQT